ncbi:MAG: HAD-IA family hydrolase [Anaerolineae bacterium]|nr:HAD-IA family hydrolase [Anaerolineae bacterium]
MIKVVLLDLDDTLISTNTALFFPTYLKALGKYAASTAGFTDPNDFVQKLVTAYNEALEAYDVTAQLYPRFLRHMAASLQYFMNEHDLSQLFTRFYTEDYPALKTLIRPRLETPPFLRWLFEHHYQVVIATNPAIPAIATLQRMDWGNIAAADYPFAGITTLENMHFGKPQPEYFEEILLRLGVSAGEAIMIGDDWENDIVGASTCGINTFWITQSGVLPPDDSPIAGYGTYQQLIALVQAGWLDILSPPPSTRHTLIHRLRAFPAQLDTLRKTYSDDVLEACPAKDEWSVRDVVCHLRDHESDEDRIRLQRIIEQDNPFLSGNYDPWRNAHAYAGIPMEQAFSEFVCYRAETVDWLLGLPEATWSRPARYAIFGPTHFEEMVRFITEHDRTHLAQIHDAIRQGLETCKQAVTSK